jgi:hyperosmotically inducible protein
MGRARSYALITVVFVAFGVAPASGKTSRPPDAWLTTKAKIAVLSKVGTAGTSVHVDTVNGRVVLHGQVGSDKDKQAAEKAARDVDGVKEVRNLLQVVPEKSQKSVEVADADVQQRVEKALKQDASLDGSRIVIQSVNNGTVLLAGKAESLSDHLSALEDARQVAGVRRVESEIESPDSKGDEAIWKKYSEPPSAKTADGESTLHSTAESVKDTMSDAYITTAAKARLLADRETPGTDINVDTDHGVVTLFGTVPTAEAKAAAAAEAQKVSGVKRVVDELQIIPPGAKEQVAERDAQIEDDAETAVEHDPALKDTTAIHIDVHDGVARLHGTVPSESERLAAVARVKKVEGVRRVQDDLKIQKD